MALQCAAVLCRTRGAPSAGDWLSGSGTRRAHAIRPLGERERLTADFLLQVGRQVRHPGFVHVSNIVTCAVWLCRSVGSCAQGRVCECAAFVRVCVGVCVRGMGGSLPCWSRCTIERGWLGMRERGPFAQPHSRLFWVPFWVPGTGCLAPKPFLNHSLSCVDGVDNCWLGSHRVRFFGSFGSGPPVHPHHSARPRATP